MKRRWRIGLRYTEDEEWFDRPDLYPYFTPVPGRSQPLLIKLHLPSPGRQQEGLFTHLSGMKRWIGAFLVLLSTFAFGQELVPNGDFESFSLCPDYVSQIDRATGWSRPTEGTSDYMNACLGVPFSLSMPDNQFGYQAAHSGNGYAGFYCFHSFSEVTTAPDGDHEYMTHALATPLIPGRQYTVEFFVSLADVSKYAVNDIGALLSMTIPTRTDELAITATPQVTNTSLTMLDDKDGWTRIQGCVIADSAYAYITVGNFRNGASTVFVEVPSNNPLIWHSYYYVDDISVVELPQLLLGPDITTCDAATISMIDPVPGALYTWSTGETGTAITVDTSGTYSVYLDVDGCVVADTIEVIQAEPITVLLPTDTAVNFCTSSITLALADLPANAVVRWSSGATTTSIPVDASGTHSVSVSAPDHCPCSASIRVVDLCATSVHAPNAFTPNADGINDVWRPVWTTNADAILEFTVFDRWGGLLFSSTDLGDGWDGTVNGTPLPSGLYPWIGMAKDPVTSRVSELRGKIALIR